MILSPSFSNKKIVLLAAALIGLAGCSAAAPPLEDLNKTPPVRTGEFTAAALPINNLSGRPAPLEGIRKRLTDSLRAEGLNLIEDQALEAFVVKHRLRYSGGITRATAEALRKETGAGAVLITSLDLYKTNPPPKIALFSRLVSTGDKLPVLWSGTVGMSGDDAPGLLGLSLVRNPAILLEKAIQHLSKSLAGHLADQSGIAAPAGKTPPFWPKEFYRSAVMSPDMRYRVAVVPFFNISVRPNAGDIMMLHFAAHLSAFGNFDIIEAGEVRQALLNLRIVMDDGVSLANADVIFSRLNADLILTGKVLEYQDVEGNVAEPKVDFSALLIEKKSREVVWSSRNYNEGGEQVRFFGWGRQNTAHSLASAMVRNAVGLIFK